jgi:hypothetical protein
MVGARMSQREPSPIVEPAPLFTGLPRRGLLGNSELPVYGILGNLVSPVLDVALILLPTVNHP